MTLAQAEEHFALITYKEKYQLHLGRDMFMDWIELRVSLMSRDANHPHINFEMPIVSIAKLDPRTLLSMELPEFLNWIRESIRALELHEMDEWLKYGDAHVHDPHPELRVPHVLLPDQAEMVKESEARAARDLAKAQMPAPVRSSKKSDRRHPFESFFREAPYRSAARRLESR